MIVGLLLFYYELINKPLISPVVTVKSPVNKVVVFYNTRDMNEKQ